MLGVWGDMSFVERYKSSKLVLFFYLLFFLCFFYATGFFNSYFSVVDDHIVIDLINQVNRDGFVRGIVDYFSEYLLIRFRPLWSIYIVFLAWLLEANHLAWAIYQALFSALTCYVLFLCLRNYGADFISSITIPIMSIFGAQLTVFWRLANTDSIALLCFFLALLQISNKFSNRKAWYTNGLISIFSLLMSLSKESYVLILPAIILLNFFASDNNRRGFKLESVSVGDWVVSLFLGAVFTGEIFYIMGHYSTSSVEFTVDLFSKNFVLYFSTLKILSIVTIGALIVSGFLFFTKGKLGATAAGAGIVFLVFLSILIPQGVLFAKAGFEGRYILPAIFAVLFVQVAVFKYLRDQIRRKYLIPVLAVITFGAQISENYQMTFSQAYAWSRMGQSTKVLIDEASMLRGAREKILIVADPGYGHEQIHALLKYLKLNGASNFRTLLIPSQNYTTKMYDYSSLAKSNLEFFKDTAYVAENDSDQTKLIIVININDDFYPQNKVWLDQDYAQAITLPGAIRFYLYHKK